MKNLISLALVVGAVAGGGWLVYFGPYYRDYYTMQEVVQSVALTWAAYDKPRGEREVGQQLAKREIDYITPQNCELTDHAGELTVSCAWQVDIYLPVGPGRRLDFEVEAAATKDGRLVNN